MLEENKIIEIYNRVNRELYLYIYRFVGSHEAAEDLFHDCFVNLIQYSGSHEVDMESIRAFLYRVAHNLSVNYLNRAKKIGFSSLENVAEPVVPDSVVAKFESAELDEKIYQLLEDVDTVSRSMFIMKKELELSAIEIAKNTGKSERTVRRRLEKLTRYLMGELRKSGFIEKA